MSEYHPPDNQNSSVYNPRYFSSLAITPRSSETKVINGNYDIFDTSITTQLNVLFQAYHLYGIQAQNQLFRDFTATGGSITASSTSNQVQLDIDTSIGSFALQRSRRIIKYFHGSSCLFRGQYIFDTPVSNSLQFMGVGTAICDLYFCYNGTDFGIRRSFGGSLEIRELEITSASTGTETATITLNNVAFSVSLTNASALTSFTAYQIGRTSFAGWNVQVVGNRVFFISASVGSRPNTYSFSSASATATFSQITQGADLTTIFTPQTEWNGTSVMNTILDPLQSNLYQIEYTWFGSGNIKYEIYNPSTSSYDVVHTLTFSNQQTTPSLTNPNMYIQYGLASLGSTTALTN
jgi:hypothetical protein